ncbi:hypothetical protein BJ875DRAFT_236393 [Amylocarpus encephaloides]|uniref:Uncharacterized protein n=1 Tax=Amylocarpus encephaloides TaxID=45428 RepID=A0A9P7Y7K5_9HELO|nr:hypothetical protein BJ875DRAFT_236393 [Amylocarpus encephaloides]
MQIIKQMGGEKLTVDWSKISLPGRTPKALSHVWAKIRADAATSGPSDGAPKVPVTPRKRASKAAAKVEPPKKKKATPRKNKNQIEEIEDDADVSELKDNASDDAMNGELDTMDSNGQEQKGYADA